jgi:hypothetical protein
MSFDELSSEQKADRKRFLKFLMKKFHIVQNDEFRLVQLLLIPDTRINQDQYFKLSNKWIYGKIMTPEEFKGLHLEKFQLEVVLLIQRYIVDRELEESIVDKRLEEPLIKKEEPKSTHPSIDEYPSITKSTHPSIDEYPSITKSTHPSVKSKSFMEKMRDLRNKSFDGISWDNLKGSLKRSATGLKKSLTRSKSDSASARTDSASARRYRKSKPKPKKKCSSRGKKKKKPSQRRKKQYM